MKKFLKYGLLSGVAAIVLMAHPARAGDYCREFTQTVRIGGKAQQGYGTACMESDGSWTIVSENYHQGSSPPPPSYTTRVPVSQVRYIDRPVYVTPRPFIFLGPRVGYHRPFHHRGSYYRWHDNGWHGQHRGWRGHEQSWRGHR